MSDEITILEGGSEPHIHSAMAGGGTYVAYTCRAPDKQTDNEDTVAVIPYGPAAAVMLVADGAGGLPAGKRASLTAATSLTDSLQTSMARTMLLRTAILDGIEAANAAVKALGNGSATTLTVITIEGRTLRSYQVGDSEAVVVGQRGLIKMQITPHSPTGFAVEAGFLDEKEALHHEDRYLVSNLLGMADMRIEVGPEVQLSALDTVLIASDGLMDNLHLAEIIDRIRAGPLDEAVEKVVSLAKRRMAGLSTAKPSKPDDLSVILYRKPARDS